MEYSATPSPSSTTVTNDQFAIYLPGDGSYDPAGQTNDAYGSEMIGVRTFMACCSHARVIEWMKISFIRWSICIEPTQCDRDVHDGIGSSSTRHLHFVSRADNTYFYARLVMKHNVATCRLLSTVRNSAISGNCMYVFMFNATRHELPPPISCPVTKCYSQKRSLKSE